MLSRLMTRREQVIIGMIALAVLAGSAAVVWNGRETEPDPLLERGGEPTATRDAAQTPEPEADAAVSVQVSVPALITPLKPAQIAVAVQGAVISPGMYRLADNERVQDLIDEAGGLTETADLSNINLAAKLIDGTTLTVPEGPGNGATQSSRRRLPPAWNPPEYTIQGWRPESASTPQPLATISTPAQNASIEASGRVSGLIDLNRATQADLEALPGIGPKLAQSIIEYRNLAPFRTVDDLLEVTGIGEKRLDAIRPMVTVQ